MFQFANQVYQELEQKAKSVKLADTGSSVMPTCCPCACMCFTKKEEDKSEQ
jgi:hypothetical protein